MKKNSWIETGFLIEKHNIQLQPCLALKLEGNKDWWSAGIMTLTKDKRANVVLFKNLAFGSNPHEAIQRAVQKIK